MIVLIPSYKRIQILSSVIKSVLQARADKINERILILVVNNYFPNKVKIESIISKIKFEGKFSVGTIHRKKTLPSVVNWYTAIFDNARENEVVALLGDDDLLLPWGLEERFKLINDQKADLLIANFYQRIYFSNHGKECLLISETLKKPVMQKVDYSLSWNPQKSKDHQRGSFISNHIYRNTKKLKDGYKKAYSWCSDQNWIPFTYSSGNLPFYMTLSIQDVGGKIINFNQKSVIRGALLEETLYQDNHDGISTEMLSLLLYNTLNNKKILSDLYRFKSLRKTYLKNINRGLYNLFINQSLTSEMFFKTLRKSNLSLKDFLSLELLINFKLLFVDIFKLRGFRLKRKSKNMIDVTDFLLNIKEIKNV